MLAEAHAEIDRQELRDAINAHVAAMNPKAYQDAMKHLQDAPSARAASSEKPPQRVSLAEQNRRRKAHKPGSEKHG